MNFFDFFKTPDINEGIRGMKENPKAVLLDVRTQEEYCEEHIPESINIPLDRLQAVTGRVSKRDTPLYVYCLSGARSRQAVHILKQYGYTDVTDLGGIQNYKGTTEKGAER